jgi:molybdopterin/thiamine biosynthesis adenylyltransferase
MKIAVIGAGGLGANVAMLLAEQGHDISIYDADHADDKFFDRFVFFSGSRVLYMNTPKTEIVSISARHRGKHIRAFPIMLDEKFDFKTITDQMVIISVDTAQARELIEARLRVAGGATFFHVGCNLNSVSIFATMRDVISDDPPADAQTSYDVVPDAKTYLRAASEVAALLDSPIRMWVDEELHPMLGGGT